jgi:multiple sugar transport system substrate-binding protein
LTEQFKTIVSTPADAAAAFTHRRTLLKAGLFGTASLAVGLRSPAVRGQAKRFAGISITGGAFQHSFHVALKSWLPELEEQTGLKVNFELQSYPIYNQRTDLELSTGGSAYDFCNLGTPYAGRWITSNWMTQLDEFARNPELTPTDWEPGDFASSAQAILSDAEGRTFGFTWVAGAILMGIARSDVLEKANLPVPKTCEELLETCRKTNQPGTYAFVNDALHHWEWPPYLMAQGGTIFRNPPSDLTPMLNTPEAIQAAQLYAELISKLSPPGGISFTDDQALRMQFAGRANIRTTSIDWLVPVAKAPESRSKGTMWFAPMPGGPAGSFPAVNANGFGIPAGSKNKEAGWTFIQWALSKASFRRMATEKGYVTVPRRSVIALPEYKEAMTFNGQDVGKLYLDTVEASGPRGYMKYRNMPVFPQVGEKINKAIEQIASGQMDAKAAMDLAQQAAIADIAKAGIRL